MAAPLVQTLQKTRRQWYLPQLVRTITQLIKTGANIATVINLCTLPVTASSAGTICGLTASLSELATLSTGIDTGYAVAGGSGQFELLINNVAQAVNTTGTLSASYSPTTGTLAAVWYIDQSASIGLSGTTAAEGVPTVGAGTYFDSVGSKQI